MKKKNYILGIVFIILGILLDQLVKVVIRVKIPEGDYITIINGFFNIAHIENTGAAWGGFSGFTIALIIVSIVILGYFIYLFKDINFKKEKMVFSISLVLVIGGTIGNLIDRLCFRSVTDFLDFNILGYDFPVFNIADILLVVGFLLFLIDMVFLDNDSKKPAKKKETKVEETKNDEVIEETENIEIKDDSLLDDGGDSNEGSN